MRKNIVKNIIVHIDNNIDFSVIANKLNEFYSDVIERKIKSQVVK